jgi:glycine betaine catabolism A
MAKRTANGAMTLPGEYYTSEQIYREELQRVFNNRWICAGRAEQIPNSGNYFLYKIGNESIIVTRTESGDICAFYNVCRHRGTRLCTEDQGSFAGKIQCPYHAWTYSLDGNLIGAPNMKDVQNFEMSRYPLHQPAIAIWEGFIFLNFSADPQPFELAYAPILDHFRPWRINELRSAGTRIYEIEANWKLVFQNYSECYHCPKVHPALAKMTPYRSSVNKFQEGPFLGGPMKISSQVGSLTVDGRSCAAPLPGLEGDDLSLVYYYTIFPTMFISPHPDYVLVHRIEPKSINHTRVICDWLFHPDAIAKEGFDPAGAIDFWDMTNRQDWHVCELSQEGITSHAYTPGPYSDLESLLAAFDQEYLKSMAQVPETAETCL